MSFAVAGGRIVVRKAVHLSGGVRGRRWGSRGISLIESEERRVCEFKKRMDRAETIRLLPVEVRSLLT